MSKRDFSAKIKSKKSRLFRDDRWEILRVHFKSLSQCAEIINVVKQESEHLESVSNSFMIDRQVEEFHDFFPIRCVACIEGYFRLIYAHLINYGPPFSENAMKFNNIQYSINTALSLESNSISIGEFISHLLPSSSLEDINKNMSALIGHDFIKEFKKELIDLGSSQEIIYPLSGSIITSHLGSVHERSILLS